MDPHPLTRQKSFVLRGRHTQAQARAINELWAPWGVDFDGGVLNLSEIFGREAPRSVEIGFGNGDTLVSLARHHPERDYLGIEVHAAGVGRVLGVLAREGLTNVRVIRHDAVEVFESGLEPGAIDEILVLFPDPWPKARHHGRRLIRPDVVPLLSRALKPDGVFRLATDWEPYAQQMLSVLDAEGSLSNVAGVGNAVPRHSERPLTRFENRGVGLGHAIVDLEYRRV